MRGATRANFQYLLCLLGLTFSPLGCGGEEPQPQARQEQQKAASPPAPTTAAKQASAEVVPDEAPDPRKQPWARKNDKRLSTIDAEIELSAEERETILELWNQERIEILRLIKDQRALAEPDWGVVQVEVAALRKGNDERVRELLGAERFAVYEKHRPAVKTPKPAPASTSAPKKTTKAKTN